jgi:protein tyrosine/serine phosphatase
MDSKNDADLILPGLWLGNKVASTNGKFLKDNNIQCVFNCTKDLPFSSIVKRKYRVPVDDNLEREEIRNMELWSYEIVYKLTRELKQGNVLVHCYAGMQRSAAVVAMYLIANHNMKKENAISFIKRKRPIAFRPYANFENAIQGFQDSYERDIIPKLLNDSSSPR